mgnify:CR=1 FL=1
MNDSTSRDGSEISNLSKNGAIQVTGRVAKPVAFRMNELQAMEIESLEDLFVICGSGDPKGRIGSCRGVLLENIIRRADVLKEDHNDTKKMYIVASAYDGHHVLFSWQEIFNTEVGGGVMVLLEKDGGPLEEDRDRFDLISALDFHMGSRYVKDLKGIEVVLIP